MVGSPYQTKENLAEELFFLKEIKPEMCGIGPFISHKNTPFKEEKSGTVEMTLFMLGLIRLTLPEVLLPATTALGTIDAFGREKGINAGANVLMPNLSPEMTRKKYALYDNKLATGVESAEQIENLKIQMQNIGYEIISDRGDIKE
jgi:biotin synthase